MRVFSSINIIYLYSDTDLDEENEARAEQAKDLLESLRENASNNAGRYEDTFIIDFFKSKLSSKPCQNQGFVLDGFPKTFKQALELFGAGTNLQGNDIQEESILGYNKKITPSFVIQLDSNEEFLKERLILLPQNIVEGIFIASLINQLIITIVSKIAHISILGNFNQHLYVTNKFSSELQHTIMRLNWMCLNMLSFYS